MAAVKQDFSDDCRVAEILSGEKSSPSANLPLFSARVEAGFPSPADDFFEKTLDLNEKLIRHPAATFFVRVSGHSMIRAGIHDGDLLIVDRALEPIDGKIVIAALNNELTVKRLSKKNGKLFLIAENPDFKPIAVSEGSSLEIWGVVTYVIHPAS